MKNKNPLAYCAECRGRGVTTVWECGALIEQCPVCCSRQVRALDREAFEIGRDAKTEIDGCERLLAARIA